MAATPGDRRTPGRRPGRSGPAAARRPERKRAERERRAAVAQVRAEERRGTRLTGRAAILVLVLAGLAITYASSVKAYLQQRDKIDALEATIAERESSIGDIQDEMDRRRDPAFEEREARKLGYVWPGETPFTVVDEDGRPLTDAEIGEQEDVPAWYDGVWASVELAGDPPTRIQPQPKERIVGSEDE